MKYKHATHTTELWLPLVAEATRGRLYRNGAVTGGESMNEWKVGGLGGRERRPSPISLLIKPKGCKQNRPNIRRTSDKEDSERTLPDMKGPDLFIQYWSTLLVHITGPLYWSTVLVLFTSSPPLLPSPPPLPPPPGGGGGGEVTMTTCR